MTATLSEIEVQALALPERERNALIVRLVDSLDSAMNESPAVIAQAWDEEIVRRVTEFEAGLGQDIPFEQVQAELDAMLNRQQV
ncbi:MAG: addiction module protein [Rhodoferax sp.]|uniref:addiction module protein n=1 Tax=Rhodoferax sp. TaxID=50421 RepID=UPI002733FAAE|nr:addiction module protein [Rhodoferax sp.]MDP2679789.1 addiction module protein [Rhodoferax sp.]